MGKDCKTFSLVKFRYQNSFSGVLKVNYKNVRPNSTDPIVINKAAQYLSFIAAKSTHKVLFGG